MAKRIYHLPALLSHAKRFGRLRKLGAKIAPSVIVSGARVEGNHANLSAGTFTGIGRAVIQCHAEVSIGDHVVINDGVWILTGSHDIDSPTYDHLFAPIRIEPYAWIGTGAIILQGVTIGRGSVVGAGSVVTKSTEPFAVVGGNPARLIGQRKEQPYRYAPSTWHALMEAWLGINPDCSYDN